MPLPLPSYEKLEVALPHGRGYPILIGGGLHDAAKELCGDILENRHAIIIADKAVESLYLPALVTAIKPHAARLDTIIIPSGEASKSLTVYASLMEDLISLGVGRDCVLLALGGGVIGDLAGFAAASLMRGVDYIQIPTTLLAMVDSSVGGKTGVNSARGKNLIGAFHQPRAVLADTDTLKSLNPREFAAGYAEVVKYGLIRDAAFFARLESGIDAVMARDEKTLTAVIRHCCAIKAEIVAEDERDTGDIRTLLNLGHTFGHAYEALGGYDGTILHGEAVAAGMVDAFRLAARLGNITDADCARVAAHLKAANLPTGRAELGGRAAQAKPDEILALMRGDKKAERGAVVLILPRAIGDAGLAKGVDERHITDILSQSGSHT